MHCINCTTELPPGAMFCGECGRAVTADSRRPAPSSSNARLAELTLEERISNLPEIVFDVPDADPPAVAEPVAEPEPLIPPEPAPVTALVVPEPVPWPQPEVAPADQPADDERVPFFVADLPTPAVERIWDLDADPESEPLVAPEFLSDALAEASPAPAEPAPAPAAEPEVVPAVASASDHPATDPPATEERCAQCGAPLETGDIFCGECGFVRPVVRPAVLPGAPGRARDTAAYDPFPWGLPPSQPLPDEAAAADRFVDDPDVDESDTRIVGPRGEGERFVLQFSTGESISVTGTGLLGRNPHAEPGEYFDSFVPISDPGRSVSKTHLEFGQENGSFWVSDRFSGNGTVVREPEQAPRRCEPGKRYRVIRGSRIEIGEQFFIVS